MASGAQRGKTGVGRTAGLERPRPGLGAIPVDNLDTFPPTHDTGGL